MVEVKIVKTKRQAKEFFRFVDYLYGDCKEYCPSYKKSEYRLFSHKKNPSLNSNEIIGFLAYQEGKVVGRILGIINRVEKEKSNIARFSHFDFINDTEVSFCLLSNLCDWAKAQGAVALLGDLSFNDLQPVGVVTKNCSKSISTFQQKYNFDYVYQHLKTFGFVVDKKLNEYYLMHKNDLEIDDVQNDIYKKLSVNKLKFVDGSTKYKIALYGRKIFDLLYENTISGYPLVISDKEYMSYLKSIKKLFGTTDLVILINENDEVVGAMLITKNTSLGLQTTCGNVLTSQNMYNVGGEFKDEHDITMLAINKSYQKEISELFSNVLAVKTLTENYYTVYSNLWLNTDGKKVSFEKNFDLTLIRSRAILRKNLGSYNLQKVEREKSTFAVPNKTTITKIIK